MSMSSKGAHAASEAPDALQRKPTVNNARFVREETWPAVFEAATRLERRWCDEAPTAQEEHVSTVRSVPAELRHMYPLLEQPHLSSLRSYHCASTEKR